jgi:lysophospholipase L1-like esterase
MKLYNPILPAIFSLLATGCGSTAADAPATGGLSGDGGGAVVATGGGSGGTGAPGGVGTDDVCRFAGEAALPAADAEGYLAIPPDHPSLWYMGRLDCDASGGPRLGFPGGSVRVRFSGTALRVTLDDSGLGTATATTYFDVTVDGGEPTPLALTPGVAEYALAEGLATGEHEVLLWKRTESSPEGRANASVTQIQGFRLLGEALLAAAGPARRVEFVGDSITCGYGNEVETTTPDDFKFTTLGENSHKAYGAVTAKNLGADYVGVSYSGKGMSRNYGDSAGERVPEFYLDTIPDDAASPAWDFSRFTPDAVVINVGTNDFSTVGVDRELFVSEYSEFLGAIRSNYPSAVIVAAIGPMLSDYYPAGADAWTNAQADVQAAVDARVAAGDASVFFLAFTPQTSPYGEDWHPTAATHVRMADAVTALLKEKLGW